MRHFIDDYRESNNPDDLVAVGSAIRTFVANASADEAFDYAATLLKSGARASLPIELELELAKMVVRKLTACPPDVDDKYVDLSNRLWELAETYLNPRLLAREKHGAVALNAALGIILAQSGHVVEVASKIRKLGVPWFEQLVARRAAKLAAEWKHRDFPRNEALLRDLSGLSVEATVETLK